MTPEQQDRWLRIRHFPIDAPGASFPFSARLARENGWTPVYAERVIEEYRRFTFLAVTAGHGASPSKAVDEAWHLHLLYTRNYWEEFCPEVLGRPLHHNPSGGTAEDENKYEGWFEETLESYLRFFGEEPPADIWRPLSPPGGRGQGVRGALARWLRRLAPALSLLLAGCAEPANPLDWHGPAFLGLFAVLYGTCLVGACLARRALLGTPEGPPADEWRLSTYDQAFLNGGGRLALASALTSLTAMGKLEIDRKTSHMRASPGAIADHPLERAVLRAAEAQGGVRYDSVHQRTHPILGEMEESLRRQGLWVDRSHLAAVMLLPFAVASLPLLLGLAKIDVGMERGRPVGFLVVGCLAGLFVNLFFFVTPKRSPYGDHVLTSLRERARTSDDLALTMALVGIESLNGGDYAYLRPVVMPAQTSSGADGGSGCGGSSCGGGGGCGGGGCGGCGS